MIRLPLFWRLLIILIIPFLVVLVIGELIIIKPIQPLINNNPFLFILISFFVTTLLIFLAVKSYSDSISKLNDFLKKPERDLFSKKTIRKLPPEFVDLHHTIKETTKHNIEVQSLLDADKKLFNSTLGSMNDGILIADQNGLVTLTNKAVCQIFKIEENDWKGRSLVGVIRDYRIKDLFEKCTNSQQHEIVSFETGPEKTFIQCIASPLTPEISGSILFLFQDLTRIRQLEIIRRDFVSNVSHELRTPLTSLKLITETLQEGAVNDPETAKNFIGKMDHEVDNLIQLVEELLELSKIESGRVPLEKRFIDPEVIVRAACERMGLQVNRAGLQLNVSVKSVLPKTMVDPAKIEQILVNLIHNAIKFTPPGEQLEVKVNVEGESIVYSVKDTGIGISAKDLDRIFERFYKTDRSRSDKGTGLGLSIARHLVEAHNGKIWAESQPGQGSTFLFKIPIH